MTLRSKNILVTGAGRGLGLAVARAVVEAGGTVYGLGRKVTAGWEAMRAGAPERMRFLEFDLAETQAVKARVFEEFVGAGTALHGVVSNAAMAYDDLVSNLDEVKLRAMYEVNVFAPMQVVKQAIRNMLLHGVAGSLVHISSVSVHTGYKGLAMYASTKGAMEAFSKNTAREWGERGIRSNCVVAGFMETEMSAALTEEQRAKIYRRTALKAATEPASVAGAVVYLLGDGAASVTGQNLVVDAGTI